MAVKLLLSPKLRSRPPLDVQPQDSQHTLPILIPHLLKEKCPQHRWQMECRIFLHFYGTGYLELPNPKILNLEKISSSPSPILDGPGVTSLAVNGPGGHALAARAATQRQTGAKVGDDPVVREAGDVQLAGLGLDHVLTDGTLGVALVVGRPQEGPSSLLLAVADASLWNNFGLI